MGPSLAAHADWSVDPRKRWITTATQTTTGWSVTAPRLVGDVATLSTRLVHQAGGGAVVLGADLPIGLPRAYAATRPEADFLDFLHNVRDMPDFFSVCSALADIRPDRPFYPARGIAGMTRLSHALALGLPAAADLSRMCDRATAERPAGAPLFWTLGANQSGKAAIAAWQSFILPALIQPAQALHPSILPPSILPPPMLRAIKGKPRLRLWPFEGPLRSLLTPGAVALAETYPAEALRHLGLRLRGSKRRHADRRSIAGALLAAMEQQAAIPDNAMRQAALDGFGSDAAGEDRFDSVLGVLCVLNVLAGHRPDTAPDDPWIQRWEGWVLGQTAMPRMIARPS